jgi:hypothetical protein
MLGEINLGFSPGGCFPNNPDFSAVCPLTQQCRIND